MFEASGFMGLDPIDWVLSEPPKAGHLVIWSELFCNPATGPQQPHSTHHHVANTQDIVLANVERRAEDALAPICDTLAVFHEARFWKVSEHPLRTQIAGIQWRQLSHDFGQGHPTFQSSRRYGPQFNLETAFFTG